MPLTPVQRRLVEDHAYLVDWGVRLSRPRLGWLDADDRRSLANEALVILARRWDPEKPASFKTFVGCNLVHTMVTLLRQETGRRGQARASVRPFDPTEVLDREIVAAAASLEHGFERVDDADEAVSILAAVLPSLRASDRFVVAEVGSGATLRQAGARRGVSESRACQILGEVKAGRRREPGRCGECGRRFQPRRVNQVYCSESCRLRAKRNAEKQRRWPSSFVVCPGCEEEFRRIRSTQVTCSSRCRKRVWWRLRHGAEVA